MVTYGNNYLKKSCTRALGRVIIDLLGTFLHITKDGYEN